MSLILSGEKTEQHLLMIARYIYDAIIHDSPERLPTCVKNINRIFSYQPLHKFIAESPYHTPRIFTFMSLNNYIDKHSMYYYLERAVKSRSMEYIRTFFDLHDKYLIDDMLVNTAIRFNNDVLMYFISSETTIDLTKDDHAALVNFLSYPRAIVTSYVSLLLLDRRYNPCAHSYQALASAISYANFDVFEVLLNHRCCGIGHHASKNAVIIYILNAAVKRFSEARRGTPTKIYSKFLLAACEYKCIVRNLSPALIARVKLHISRENRAQFTKMFATKYCNFC